MNLKQRASELKQKIAAVFLALKKKDTPLFAKFMAGLTVAYALSPIDLIPDFIPILGYLDDLIILPLLIGLTVKLIPIEIMTECEEEAKDLWKNGKPKRWYFALPIILLWFIIIVIIYETLRK
ncbi:MAG: YkvA family protein [Mobilitalea sp.]